MARVATVKEILELIEAHDYRCALTGVELTTENAALDHIVPVADGGGSEIENLMPVHREVNRMKDQLSLEDFRAWIGMAHAKL